MKHLLVWSVVVLLAAAGYVMRAQTQQTQVPLVVPVKSSDSGTITFSARTLASKACTSITSPAVAATTAMRLEVSSNQDLSTVAGFTPSTSGLLTIYSYITPGNVNFKVCNSTNAQVSLGSLTLQWSVVYP